MHWYVQHVYAVIHCSVSICANLRAIVASALLILTMQASMMHCAEAHDVKTQDHQSTAYVGYTCMYYCTQVAARAFALTAIHTYSFLSQLRIRQVNVKLHFAVQLFCQQCCHADAIARVHPLPLYNSIVSISRLPFKPFRSTNRTTPPYLLVGALLVQHPRAVRRH
jgi:hypothetical protein